MLIPTWKPDLQPSWSQREGGGGRGGALPSPPQSPLYFCPRVKGVLWGSILLALPQPASSLYSPEEHSSSPALAFTGTLLGSIPEALPQPKTGSLGTHSCSTFSPSPFPSPHLPLFCLSLAFLRSPALGRSIAPIASGTQGNPYPCAPLAHCSGHSLSAWKGVTPLPDRGEAKGSIDRGDM